MKLSVEDERHVFRDLRNGVKCSMGSFLNICAVLFSNEPKATVNPNDVIKIKVSKNVLGFVTLAMSIIGSAKENPGSTGTLKMGIKTVQIIKRPSYEQTSF